MSEVSARLTARVARGSATLLVGYGTLLNRRSLGDSIGQDSAGAKEVIPVIVHGYRRLFNLRPDHYESSFRLGTAAIENAAANLEEASGNRFNGLAFPVTTDELEALDERERYYERRQVTLHAFDTGELIGEGHAYVSLPDARWIERDPTRLMPLWRDIVWSRGGAYRVGERFGRVYDETTLLADGTTLLIDSYRDLLEA
jgi:cation transport regulator ChaC